MNKRSFGRNLGAATPSAYVRPTKPMNKALKLLKSMLVGGAVLGLVQPAFAIGIDQGSTQSIFPTSGQGVYAALLDIDGPGAKPTQASINDEALSALADFANGAGVKSSAAHKDLVKVAEAESLLDALKGMGNGTGLPTTAAPIAKREAPAHPTDATYVGDKVCIDCHLDHTEAFSKTLMGRLWKEQAERIACENCHGAGSAHVKAAGPKRVGPQVGPKRFVGGLNTFDPKDTTYSAEESNAICLSCHERGDRTYWKGSTHESRNLMCTNCHLIMRKVGKNQLKTEFQPETCFQCHKDRRAQMWRSSHMPIREGKIVCSDCHNPHGTPNPSLLRTATVNDTCYKCHAEKRGPFLFEHAPVRENCLNCHDPHGTINEYSLKMQRPRLCTTCHGFGHSQNAGPAGFAQVGRACNNCHTQVHGSNSPSGAMLHR